MAPTPGTLAAAASNRVPFPPEWATSFAQGRLFSSLAGLERRAASQGRRTTHFWRRLQCIIDLKANVLRFTSTDTALPFLAEASAGS